nr:MAG TPA: hypothetical protein [Caudoviricetes sp.]
MIVAYSNIFFYTFFTGCCSSQVKIKELAYAYK